MQYGEIKRQVLELINQYSVAGENVSPAYNNQSDYLHRIPNLINLAIMDIRTNIRSRQGVHHWTAEGDAGKYYPHRMPEKAIRWRAGTLRRMDENGLPQPDNDYRIVWEMVYTRPGEYTMEYDRLPERLPTDTETGVPADEYEMDEEQDVIAAAVCYAAAGLVRMDSAFDFAALSNEYESRKAAMRPHVTAEILPIQGSGGEIGIGYFCV